MGRRFGDAFRLTLLTDNPQMADAGDRAGVNRIGVDLERIGKAGRQAGLDLRLSGHRPEDLRRIAPFVRSADLFARINPIHEGTTGEIETVLDFGARALMLPNFETAEEVSVFTAAVHGRAWTMLLVETAPAATRIRDILSVPGVDEVMVGLNDLHLQLGVHNSFEVLASPMLDILAAEVARKGLPFGVGGVGRIDDTTLAIPPDLVCAQYPRLGATGAWLARVFNADMPEDWDMTAAVAQIRHRLSEWSEASPDALEEARTELASRARLSRSGRTS